MKRGESPTVIARTLGDRRTSLYRWKKIAQASPEGLAARPHPGARAPLTAEQLRGLEALLLLLDRHSPPVEVPIVAPDVRRGIGPTS